MWLRKKTYNIGVGCSQTVVRLFDYPIMFNKSPLTYTLLFGSPGIGLSLTKNPSFSVRNRYKKSIKLGKYYIVKL